jgi:hypothetical protein
MHDEMEACSRSIAALHGEITAAVQQNGEARADEGAARFALVRCVCCRCIWCKRLLLALLALCTSYHVRRCR